MAKSEFDPDWDLTALRPVTRRLVESVMLDLFPEGPAVAIDFGITSERHFEAIYYPLRAGEITPMQLKAALGNGPRLTELTRSAASNPHKAVTFKTAWDDIMPRRAAPAPSPAPTKDYGVER
jgi:hypothetical protein